MQGWTLHSVGNSSVTSKEDVPFQSLRLKHGCVDCVFFDYSSSLVQSSKTSAWSAQLFGTSPAYRMVQADHF